jgi:hypothetical protein
MVRRSNKTVEAILAASRKNEEKDVVLDRKDYFGNRRFTFKDICAHIS